MIPLMTLPLLPPSGKPRASGDDPWLINGAVVYTR